MYITIQGFPGVLMAVHMNTKGFRGVYMGEHSNTAVYSSIQG